MYINKMIFMEREDVDQDVYEFLREQLIKNTDYGTCEITQDMWQDFIENVKDYDLHNLTLQQIREGLGTDVAEMLEKDELDFVQFIYPL